MRIECQGFALLDKRLVPFAQLMRPKQYPTFWGAVVGIVGVFLDFRLPIVEPYRLNNGPKPGYIVGKLIPYEIVNF